VATLILTSWLLAFGSRAAEAEYKLAPGDVLSLYIAGIPELSKQKLVVDFSGNVTLPLAGSVKAAGYTLTELLSTVRAELANRVVSVRTVNSGQRQTALLPDEITLAISEYRPVYIKGDVARPSEVAFRPGMTVRQAIAVAGGYDLLRGRPTGLILEVPNIKSEFDAAWIALARDLIHLAHLKSELSGSPPAPVEALSQAPIPDSTKAELQARAAEQAQARQKEMEKEKKYIDDAISRVVAYIQRLRTQRDQEVAGAQADMQDYDRVKNIFEAGNTRSDRVVDARRASLVSATRVLQTENQMNEAERERDELVRRRERLQDQRRKELLSEISALENNVATLRLRVRAARQRLLYSGNLSSEPGRISEATAEVIIYRRDDKTIGRLAATEDTDLSPGDAIEVILRSTRSE